MLTDHDIWPGNPAWVAIRETRVGEQSREAQGSGKVEASWEADDRAAGARRRKRGSGKMCHKVSSG